MSKRRTKITEKVLEKDFSQPVLDTEPTMDARRKRLSKKLAAEADDFEMVKAEKEASANNDRNSFKANSKAERVAEPNKKLTPKQKAAEKAKRERDRDLKIKQKIKAQQNTQKELDRKHKKRLEQMSKTSSQSKLLGSAPSIKQKKGKGANNNFSANDASSGNKADSNQKLEKKDNTFLYVFAGVIVLMASIFIPVMMNIETEMIVDVPIENNSSVSLLKSLASKSEAHALFYDEFRDCVQDLEDKRLLYRCIIFSADSVAEEHGEKVAKEVSIHFEATIQHIRRYQGKENQLDFDNEIGL